MRTAQIQRKTAETDISLSLDLDGKGVGKIDTGLGFLDHMLTLFTRHAGLDMELTCNGDTWVDGHHTAEDVGICLGQALLEALGDKKGISRYGDALLPMDEALILCALDISGRGYLGYDLSIPAQKVGDFDTELVEEFFMALTRNGGITLHLRQLAGSNSHHIIEGAFKALGRSVRKAVAIDQVFRDTVPSTKGVL